MTLNNVSGCVRFFFSVVFFETRNVRVAALPALSEHSAENVGIAKTYVLRFRSLVCSSLFFSLSSKSVLPGSFTLDKEPADLGTPIRRCYLDPIRLMMATHLTRDALKFSRSAWRPPAWISGQWCSWIEMSRTLSGLGLGECTHVLVCVVSQSTNSLKWSGCMSCCSPLILPEI